jgi:hypothetical protein
MRGLKSIGVGYDLNLGMFQQGFQMTVKMRVGWVRLMVRVKVWVWVSSDGFGYGYGYGNQR